MNAPFYPPVRGTDAVERAARRLSPAGAPAPSSTGLRISSVPLGHSLSAECRPGCTLGQGATKGAPEVVRGRGPVRWSDELLADHGGPEAFVGRDEVVVVVGAGVELHPVDPAVESAVVAGVVVADG